VTKLMQFLACGLVAAGLYANAAYAEQAPAAKTPVAQAGEKPEIKLPDTLMFTIDEFNDIQSHMTSGASEDENGKANAIESASLYLSTILYFSPTDWTIWVNGVPISPDQEFQAFKVTQIGPDHVELLVPFSAQGMRPVRLGPNQTFVTKSGVVIEGRYH
jgi:hypothetical protein